MNRAGTHVPDLVRQRAEASGEAGRRWLTGLPDLLEDLSSRWGLTLGSVLDGGTASLVAEATDGDDHPCVVKIAMPSAFDEGSDVDSFNRSVLAHRLADGRGCVRLLAYDESVAAVLLERLGPNLHDLNLPVDEVIDVVANTLRSFWRPVDDPSGLVDTVASAAWLAGFIEQTWEQLDRPCSRAVVDRSLRYCDQRAAESDPAKAVLVHGDAHGWNTLAVTTADKGSERAAYKLVDPEGLFSEREHDLAVPMREYNKPLLAGDTPTLVRARARRLADLCDADAEKIWQWGFIERVSTGLANLRDFDDNSGPDFLEVAHRCL